MPNGLALRQRSVAIDLADVTHVGIVVSPGEMVDAPHTGAVVRIESYDWPDYLAPWINDIAPGSGQDFMYLVGVIEILAGVAVALKPRYGAYVARG